MGDWSLGVQAGVYLGFLTSVSGQISDENGDDVAIFDVQDDLFRSKFAVNYYVGGKFSYNFKKNFSIYASPHVRIAPHDASSSSYPVATKYFFVGGNIGLSYRFGK